MYSRSFKERFQGSKLNGLWRFLYHWKALRMYMSKMGSHCSFRHLKHKLWPKERQFDSWPQKLWNRADLLVCRGRATYRWKAFDKRYNFALDRISISGLLAKLWGSKVTRVPTWTISGLPLGSPETKTHLDVGFVANHKVYYKGEGGGFPQVQAVVNHVCSCCPWLVLAPKMLQLCTNHLVWVLCRPVWVNEACQLFVVPSWSSSMPLYPLKVLWARERASTPPSSVVFYLDSHLSPSRSWECVNVSVSLAKCFRHWWFFQSLHISLFHRKFPLPLPYSSLVVFHYLSGVEP